MIRQRSLRVFDEHARVVYAHAVRATGDWALAEDVMSLTFLEAWRQREKLRKDVRNMRAWLLGIATNVLRNTARSTRRHRAAMSRLPPAEPMPDFSEAVVEQMADSQRLAAAARALNRLKRGEREVFALVVWSGLGYADAAEALGIPTGTVRSWLSRAREKLRRLTEEELANGQQTESQADRERASARRATEARSFQRRNAS